jgi:hypothetical protein
MTEQLARASLNRAAKNGSKKPRLLLSPYPYRAVLIILSKPYLGEPRD